jgi:hypothetical protein
LIVTKTGFRPVKRSGVNVSINNITRIDAVLEVGGIAETVDVSASATVLQTDRAEVRAEITTRTLSNLPVPPGRNYQGLFVLIPGFTPPENRHSVPGNPSRALIFSVNGTSGQSNNTRIDGASSSNIWRPDAVAYVPALESIETVNVVTNSFDAEQGLAGGAAINVQIKSGTNQVHGSAFEYYNGNRTKARPFFLPANEQKPKDVFNQFGGTIGGPIVRDKIFYFASYEGTYNHRFASLIGSVPTPAMRAGDLSGAPAGRPIYDPFTGAPDGSGRTPFAGNQIPISRMPPAVQRILPLWPNPTGPGTQNNYYAAGQFTLDRNTLDTKFNWNATPKLNMYGRYSYLHFETANRQFFGEELGGAPIAGGQAGFATGHSTSITAAGTYVLRPNFLIDAYFGYTRMQADSRQPRLDEKIGQDFLGLPGTNGPRWFEGGWPQFNIAKLHALRGAKRVPAKHSERPAVSICGERQLDDGHSQCPVWNRFLPAAPESDAAGIFRRVLRSGWRILLCSRSDVAAEWPRHKRIQFVRIFPAGRNEHTRTHLSGTGYVHHPHRSV